jgi:hypothetical protein
MRVAVRWWEASQNVGTLLVADCQSAEAAEPSQRAFHHPAMPSQALAALDAAPGDPVTDPSLAQSTTTARQVIGFIGREFTWALA